MMASFRMIKINVDQFAILSDEPVSGGISLNFSMSFQYSSEGKRIACAVDIKYEKDSVVIILLKMTCEFAIPDNDWAKYSEGDKFEIPKDLQKMLAVQTIGASRGVLFCKTEGSPFANLILPSINVAAMIDDK